VVHDLRIQCFVLFCFCRRLGSRGELLGGRTQTLNPKPFFQALGIARGALGRENTVVATFLHKLGHAYEDLGMADDAEAMFMEEREVRSVIEERTLDHMTAAGCPIS
jgi:hypothetical protein